MHVKSHTDHLARSHLQSFMPVHHAAYLNQRSPFNAFDRGQRVRATPDLLQLEEISDSMDNQMIGQILHANKEKGGEAKK